MPRGRYWCMAPVSGKEPVGIRERMVSGRRLTPMARARLGTLVACRSRTILCTGLGRDLWAYPGG